MLMNVTFISLFIYTLVLCSPSHFLFVGESLGVLRNRKRLDRLSRKEIEKLKSSDNIEGGKGRNKLEICQEAIKRAKALTKNEASGDRNQGKRERQTEEQKI